MRSGLVPIVVLGLDCAPTSAISCSLIPPSRPPTIAEQVSGLKTIFGGTVIGYLTSDGAKLLGPIPERCLDKEGRFPWWNEAVLPECRAYLETEAALFRVDTPIVGPDADEVVQFYMTWGDGDCNNDFDIGEKWLIAGEFTQELSAPVREDEIALLRRLASHPPFDRSKLYR